MRELQVRQVVLLEMIALGADEQDDDDMDGGSQVYLDGSLV